MTVPIAKPAQKENALVWKEVFLIGYEGSIPTILTKANDCGSLTLSPYQSIAVELLRQSKAKCVEVPVSQVGSRTE